LVRSVISWGAGEGRFVAWNKRIEQKSIDTGVKSFGTQKKKGRSSGGIRRVS